MNISRGLFRLWVVISFVWIVAMGFVFYRPLANPYVAEQAFYFPKNITAANAKAVADKSASPSKPWGRWEITTLDGFKYTVHGTSAEDANKRLQDVVDAAPYELGPVTVEPYTPEHRSLEEAKASGIIQEIAIGALPEFSLFISKQVSGTERDRQIDETFRVGSELRKTIISKRRSEDLAGLAGVALIPPLILLVAGKLSLWIARGFRATA